MTQPKDYQLTKRFKATLANFHSYCQRQKEDYPEIKTRSGNVNTSMYRSIREIRKLSAGKKDGSQARRREGEGSEPVLNLRSADLIQIIKMKLNNSQPMHLKTEGNEPRNPVHPKRYNNLQFTHFNNKSMELTHNPTRRKRFNFVVNNCKIKLAENPKTKREKKYEECVVTLQNRPQSAIQQPLKYASADDASFKHKYSQSQLVKHKLSETSLHHYKHTRREEPVDMQRSKDLSGWEMNVFQDELITLQSLQKHSQKRKRNKFQ